MSNVLQFKLKEKPKLKRKSKPKFYIGIYKSKTRKIQGWGINKKEFLKDCVSVAIHMLDEYKPETSFICIKKTFKKKITKNKR